MIDEEKESKYLEEMTDDEFEEFIEDRLADEGKELTEENKEKLREEYANIRVSWDEDRRNYGHYHGEGGW